jgi:hypothetical protein
MLFIDQQHCKNRQQGTGSRAQASHKGSVRLFSASSSGRNPADFLPRLQMVAAANDNVYGLAAGVLARSQGIDSGSQQFAVGLS